MSNTANRFRATSHDLQVADTANKPAKRGRVKRAPKPGRHGWNVRGGGYVPFVEPAPEWRGASNQVCGFWPFSAGSALPPVGTPLGHHLTTGMTVCADPISWFVAGMVNTPSAFVLGRPGLGKSTLIRRIITGLAERGVWAMVLGDLKPDYVELLLALGGQVIRISRSVGTINPMDLYGAHGQIQDLPPEIRKAAMAQLIGYQLNTLQGLIALVRGEFFAGDEVSILSTALNALQTDATGEPLPREKAPEIRDLIDLISERHPVVRAMALDDGDDAAYDKATRRLRLSLMALLKDGPFGAVFDGKTTVQMKLDRPAGFDISDLDGADQTLQAAVQLVCWSYGSATTALATKLADEGLAPRRRYLLVMDELWRMLKASAQMIDRVDTITRINRELGLGQIMATHTMSDLEMDSEKQTKQAWGFVERSSLVFLGGLADGEFGNIESVFATSAKEKEFITAWASEGGHASANGGVRPGRGKFLLKMGKTPGIPFEVRLTPAEFAVNDTNRRWAELAVAKREQTVEVDA